MGSLLPTRLCAARWDAVAGMARTEFAVPVITLDLGKTLASQPQHRVGHRGLTISSGWRFSDVS